MTYDQYFAEVNGQWVDEDGYPSYNPYQCADVITRYSRELGLPRFSGNAADFADQYPAGYVHVAVPQRGDIVVFARNAANGYAGHVAIYDRPGYYLSQNYPTGSNTHLQYINEQIISIIRPTNLTGGNVPDLTQDVINLRNQLTETQVQVESLRAQIAAKDTEIQARIKQTTDAQVQVEQLRAQKPGTVTKQSVLDYLNNHLT